MEEAITQNRTRFFRSARPLGSKDTASAQTEKRDPAHQEAPHQLDRDSRPGKERLGARPARRKERCRRDEHPGRHPERDEVEAAPEAGAAGCGPSSELLVA